MPETDPRRGERGTILIVALLVMVLLVLLGVTLLSLSDDGIVIAANDEWSEGAFFAAESAVQSAMDQVTNANVDSPPAVALTTINERYTFRTGGRADANPQPPTFLRQETRSGFSVGTTTGYSQSSRFTFYIYQVAGTGFGPRNSSRQIEVQFEYGPVGQ